MCQRPSFPVSKFLKCAALLAACIGSLSDAASAQDDNGDVSLSLQQARVLAGEALRAGDLNLARKLALGLVKADETDPYPYAILTSVYRVQSDPRLSRAAARLHYKYSEDGADRFHAAHVAGQVAFDQNRHTAAQFWLRRAALHTETQKQTASLARDYSAVRRQNPFHLALRTSITPSDNVNNGANDAVETVNGEPTFAIIAPGSLALSGTVATLDANLRYRLRQAEGSQTRLGTQLYTRQVRLTEEARAQSPDSSDDDFGVTYADVSLDHTFRLGKPGNFAGLNIALGRVWAADERAYDLKRLALKRNIRLSKTDLLGLQLTSEWRDYEAGAENDSRLTRLVTRWQHAFENQDRVSLSLQLEDVASDARNAAYESWSLKAAYNFGRNFGPVQLSTSLTIGGAEYGQFERFGPVPGGRSDETFGADVSVFFTELDYAGFAPSMNVKATRTDSNVSRYATEQISVSFGIQSKF